MLPWGKGIVVRLLEYVIGALTGRYRQPDPSLHPRGGRTRTYPSSSHTDHGMRDNNDVNQGTPFAAWDKTQEVMDKVAEIKKCLRKILPAWEAHERATTCLGMYSLTNDIAVLDTELANVRRIAKLEETSTELNYIGGDLRTSKANYSNLHATPVSFPSNNNMNESRYSGWDNKDVIKDALERLENYIKGDITTSMDPSVCSAPSFVPFTSDSADECNSIPSFEEIMGRSGRYFSTEGASPKNGSSGATTTSSTPTFRNRKRPVTMPLGLDPNNSSSDFFASVRNDLLTFSKKFMGTSTRGPVRQVSQSSAVRCKNSIGSLPKRNNDLSAKSPTESQVTPNSESTRYARKQHSRNVVSVSKQAAISGSRLWILGASRTTGV